MKWKMFGKKGITLGRMSEKKHLLLATVLLIALCSFVVLAAQRGPVEVASCFDNDWGVNFLERGDMVVETLNGQTHQVTDYCIDHKTLVEYSCGYVYEGEQAMVQTHNCLENDNGTEGGCSNGACVW